VRIVVAYCTEKKVERNSGTSGDTLTLRAVAAFNAKANAPKSIAAFRRCH